MKHHSTAFGSWVVCGAVGALLGGCATAGRSDYAYSSPSTRLVQSSEGVINEPFDTVWDRLVGRLATGFFIINNIDKASRLINVSYSSDSPGDFVDCGSTTRGFSFKNESRTFTYRVADSSAYKYAGKWGPLNNLPVVAEVSRQTSVEGRINLYVAPVSASATRVTANVKYVFQVATAGVATSYNAFGGVVSNEPIPRSTEEISFSTSEPGSKVWGAPTNTVRITCESTGQLEKSLLAKAAP